jgi:hypothetical protein
MNSVINKILVVSLILLGQAAHAVNITLPENELPSETVVPKTDSKSVVLNRTIQKSHRVSLGVGAGVLLDEAFYNAQALSFEVRYNTDEKGAWGFRYDTWMGDATTYTDTFYGSTAKLQFGAAPARKSGAFILRSFDLYYGKVSLGKEVISPMSFSWIAAVGAQNYETTWLPALQGGAQVKLYMCKSTSIDLAYLFSFYQKVDPTSINVRESNGKPSADAFEKKYSFGQFVQLGVTQLF